MNIQGLTKKSQDYFRRHWGKYLQVSKANLKLDLDLYPAIFKELEDRKDLSSTHIEAIRSIYLDQQYHYFMLRNLAILEEPLNAPAHIKRKVVDLNLILTSLLPLLQRQSNTKNLELKIIPSTKLPLINFHSSGLQQVLFNLLDNAIKFTPTGMIEVAFTQIEGHLRCSVIDAGIGMDQDEVESLFYGNPELSEATSTGIGIIASQRILTNQNINLHYESELGQGTVVSFDLPLATYEEGQLQLPIDPQSQIAKNSKQIEEQKIIVFGEDQEFFTQYKGYLKKDFEVVPFSDPHVLMHYIKDYKPNLLVIDFQTEKTNVFDLLVQIRQTHNLVKLPIVIFTNEENIKIQCKAFTLGANDIICKEVNPLLLKMKLIQLMALQKQLPPAQPNTQKEGSEQNNKDVIIFFNHQDRVTYINAIGEHALQIEPRDYYFHSTVDIFGFSCQEILEKHFKKYQPLGLQLDLKGQNQKLFATLHNLPEGGGILFIHGLSSNVKFPFEFEHTDSLKVSYNLDPWDFSAHFSDFKRKQTTPILALKTTQKTHTPTPNSRAIAVELMHLCLDTYEQKTGNGKVDFAIESKIWKATLDHHGSYRTRTLDRYLQLNSLPEFPRYNKVITSAHYLMGMIPTKHGSYPKFNQLILELKQSIG